MNLVCNIVFIISAITVIIFDYKIQKIPIILIIINYSSICMLLNPILLVGNIAIVIFKVLDIPIDIIYIILLSTALLINKNIWNVLCIIPILIQTVFSKKEKICLMVSIEIACIILLLTKIILK